MGRKIQKAHFYKPKSPKAMNSYSTTGSLHLKPKPNPLEKEELSASISTLFYINLHLRPPLRGFTLIWGSLYSVVLRLSGDSRVPTFQSVTC